MDNIISYERYHRQLILKNFGEAGQQKLLQAKVLVIGAGGLGCPALQYLAAAGVGTIGIVDDDMVALSNLHRQVLYTVNDIGLPKATCAATVLRNINPEINVVAYQQRLTAANALAVINAYDIVIDGTDNFSSRYMINDACVLLQKPLVYGAVSQFEGQVALFNHHNSSVNYRDLFPDPPHENEVLNCATAGVLGVLPGIIGTMQANETIKLLTGIGQALTDRLLTYNALTNQMYELELSPRPETRSLIPATKNAFKKTDYDWWCSEKSEANEIDFLLFDKWIINDIVDVIDVREMDEIPVVTEFVHHKIPLGQLQNNLSSIKSGTVIIFCQSGVRSLQAVKELMAIFGTAKKIYSLRGGIIQWKLQHTKQPV